jgi:hypothetical protein
MRRSQTGDGRVQAQRATNAACPWRERIGWWQNFMPTARTVRTRLSACAPELPRGSLPAPHPANDHILKLDDREGLRQAVERLVRK